MGALPCPCCGKRSIGLFKDYLNTFEDEYGESSLTYYIKCVLCGTRSGNYDTEPDTIEAWNRRDPWEPAPQSSFGKPSPPSVSSNAPMVSSLYKTTARSPIGNIGDFVHQLRECRSQSAAA